MINPPAENYSNWIRDFLNLLIKLIFSYNLNEPLLTIRREKLRVVSHHLQQLIPLFVNNNVYIIMLGDGSNDFLFAYVVEADKYSVMLVFIQKLLNEVYGHLQCLILRWKIKLLFQESIIQI